MIFKGIYDLEGTQAWLKEIEKIFQAMVCTEVHKVQFGPHIMLEGSMTGGIIRVRDWKLLVLRLLGLCS